MHLAEGILPARQAIAAFILAAPIVAFSALRLRENIEDKRLQRPFMTMAFALCFATTLLPIPVPIAGATSHMCATPFLALLLGPSVLALPVLGLLFIQAIFFAHGGLTTLGANVLSLGIIGPWLTYFLFVAMKRISIPAKLNIGIACTLGSLTVYVVDAALLAWAVQEKTPFPLTFKFVLLAFLPIQLPISILEGILSAFILTYLAKYRHDFVQESLYRYLRTSHRQIIGTALVVQLSLLVFENTGFAFEGIDDSIFKRIAIEGGQNPWSVVPWMEGQILLSAFSVGFFIAGYLVGRSREQLRSAMERRVPHAP